MPRQVKLHQLRDLSHEETPTEVIIDTLPNTELHIFLSSDVKDNQVTIIKFPFGNKWTVVDGCIVIHNKP